ncbi:DUF1015 domain-containing protein [Candidatus Omnitrophota bacterium]
MTKIRPFRAVIYNQDKIKDPSKVVCPPYDVISPRRQQYFHQLDPHNFIHLSLGRSIKGVNKYRRARMTFQKWLKEKVLIREEYPALYLYSQDYKLRGERRQRWGLIGLLRLQNKDSAVYGHEHTRLEPKADRLKILKAVKANLSPIFVLCRDKKRIIRYATQHCTDGRKPLFEVTDDEKVTHKLWRIDSPEMIEKIQSALEKEDIFIADGHHRYEVACAYRKEKKKRLASFTGDEDFNYIMAYCTNFESRDLTILPVHRLVKVKSKFDSEKFMSGLKSYFEVEEYPDAVKFFFLLEKAGKTEHVIGMYRDNKYWLLRLKNIRILDKTAADKPREYRSLNVSILNHIILKKMLDLDLENKERITFSPNADELISKARASDSQIVFFLNPVKVEEIISIALAGHKMPSKSTYFYPKVLSGLVVNKFLGRKR